MTENKDNFNENDVAIIGLGFRLPGNSSPKEFWNNLMNKQGSIVETSDRWNDNFHKMGQISSNYAGLVSQKEWESFDPLFFGINPSEVETIDPQQRVLLKCVWEALEDARIDPIKIRGSNTSVFMGVSANDYQDSIKSPSETVINIFGSRIHSIPNRVSFAFDFNGESSAIDTACCSSGSAVKSGYDSIRNGSSDLSIAGGVSIILNTTNSRGFTALNMLSKTGVTRAFDADADGLVRSEGVGLVVMKNIKKAITDGNKIYCVIKGASTNVDGYKIDKPNFYSPSSTSQSDNIENALKSTNGRVSATDIDYFEAHGTGTPTGDPTEAKSISNVFKNNHSIDRPLLMGSIKTFVGHLEAASGIASLIRCSLVLKNKCFSPDINFENPNPAINFKDWNLKVITEPTLFKDYKKDVLKNENQLINIAVNNFGITGSNSTLILTEFNDQSTTVEASATTESTQQQQFLIPISSNSIKSLSNYKSLLNDTLMNGNFQFNEFVKNQIFSKSLSLFQREVNIARNWEEYFNNETTSLFKTKSDKSSNVSVSNKKNPIKVFIFSGQGSQFNRMGLYLYNTQPVFKQTIDLFDEKLSKYYGYSILEKLRSIDDNDLKTIHDPIIAQPANCILQIALFQLYKHWGINPSFIVGHSLGELSGAYCSGMVDSDTICYLIYHRSVAQESTSGLGKMLSINISPEEFNLLYGKQYPKIEIACYNSPSSIVVAGNEKDLIEIQSHNRNLNSNSGMATFLGTHSSFHTSSQKIVQDYIMDLKFKRIGEPIIPTFSTLHSRLFNANDGVVYDNEYFFNNISKPVLFSQTISNLYQHIESNQLGNDIIYFELSPHSTLSYYLKQMVPKDSDYFDQDLISIYSPLHKKKNDTFEFYKMISQIYCQGYNFINFKCQFSNDTSSGSRVDETIILPSYQWDDEKFWKEDSEHQKVRLQGPPIDSLGRLNDFNTPLKTYETFIDISKEPFAYLKGHMVNKLYYFPGSGYIDNILKLFNDKNQHLIIENLEFKSPFILIDGLSNSGQRLQTCISNNKFIEFYYFKDQQQKSKNNQEQPPQWVLLAKGNIQVNEINQDKKMELKENKLNLDQLISNKCNLTQLTSTEFYNKIKLKTGLAYSGAFKKVINTIYMGDNCSLIQVSLDLAVGFPSNKDTFFNSSILDCTTHGMMGLIDDECQLVFDRIEGLNYYPNNLPISSKEKPNSVYVFTQMKSQLNNSYYSTIKIMLEDGTVLIDIENVVSTSLIPIIKSNVSDIKYNTNEIYSKYLQSKESQLASPFSFKSIYQQDKFKIVDEYTPFIGGYQSFISNLLYFEINKRCPEITKQEISNLNLSNLKEKYYNQEIHSLTNERLFKFCFETIKQFGDLADESDKKIKMSNEFNTNNLVLKDIIQLSVKVMAKLLFPIIDEDPSIDTPQSLFEDGILDTIYTDSNFVLTQKLLMGEIVKQLIKPLVKEKMVFRILEFGGGVASLSRVVLDNICSLLGEYGQGYEIDIEYTWSDISPSFIPDAKVKLDEILNKYNIGRGINIIYKSLDLESDLLKRQTNEIKTEYYDLVVIANVLHVIKDIKYGLDQIHKLLVPNGHLIFMESPYNSLILDSIFGVFNQWWAFTDHDFRNESCCMKQESWYRLLNLCNFQDIVMSNETESTCFIIHTKKPNLIENQKLSNSDSSNDTSEVIIYGFENDINNLSNKFISLITNKSIIKISNINQFKELKLKENSIIYFIKSIHQLDINNFKSITMEYIEINQILLKLKLDNCKHILITNEYDGVNYLSSSIIGASRYFDEFPQLELTTLNFDTKSIESLDSIGGISLIKQLSIKSMNNQNEFIIKNNKVYYERFKLESNLSNSFKLESFENLNDIDSLYSKLSKQDMELKLISKIQLLNQNEIEIEIISTMVNNNGTIDNGSFYGKVKRIGNGVKSNKLNDLVYGLYPNSSDNMLATNIIIDSNLIYKKPKLINDEISSTLIPYYYTLSYYSIYNLGNLIENQSLLINLSSSTLNIGLSILSILKFKNFKSKIYIIVENEIDENLILNSSNLDIKTFISNIGSNQDHHHNHQGIDLVLNTIPNFKNLNFKLLNNNCKIIDLSINTNEIQKSSDNQDEFINLRKLKLKNITYQSINLNSINSIEIRKLLKKISKEIKDGNLEITNFKNYNQFENVNNLLNSSNEESFTNIYKFENRNEIIKQQISMIKSNEYSILKSNYKIKKSNLGENILVTGQTGIILEILKWLIQCSESNTIKNIIILSKSNLKWELKLLINKYSKSHGIKFHFKSVDVGNTIDLNNAIDDILNNNRDSINNIDSIFHFAFTQVACKVEEISIEHLNISHASKTMGAINLHNQSIDRKWNLINFIMASSIASITGSTDQCSYVSTCNVLDSLSNYRKSIGLPSICTNYGFIKSTGFVSRNDSVAVMLDGLGFDPTSTNTILFSLDLQIQNQDQSTNLILNNFNFKNLKKNFANPNKLQPIYLKFDYQLNSIDLNKKSSTLDNQQQSNANDENSNNNENVFTLFFNKISEILSIDETKINQDLRLLDYGADSLVIVQIKNWVDTFISTNLITINQLQNNTISSSINVIKNNFEKLKEKELIDLQSNSNVGSFSKK